MQRPIPSAPSRLSKKHSWLAVEALEDRTLPSAALPLDLAPLDDGLFSDAIFGAEATPNQAIRLALAALQASSQGLPGNAATPIANNAADGASTNSTGHLSVNAGPLLGP